MGSYDIWTFTDASIAKNSVSKGKKGIYGFVHMYTYKGDGNLYPIRSGFRESKTLDINTLEVYALHLAMGDLWQYHDHPAIIVTDSDNAYNNVRTITQAVMGLAKYPDAYSGVLSKFKEAVLACSKLYAEMLSKRYKIRMCLCKSHVNHIEQMKYFKRHKEEVDMSFVRNVCCGNSYIDYLTSNIATNKDVSVLEQYGNHLTGTAVPMITSGV